MNRVIDDNCTKCGQRYKPTKHVVVSLTPNEARALSLAAFNLLDGEEELMGSRRDYQALLRADAKLRKEIPRSHHTGTYCQHCGEEKFPNAKCQYCGRQFPSTVAVRVHESKCLVEEKK